MPRIKQLPPSVVNKIAAGEVIERPASVVKELLENSVDAGADRIDVSVERGGGDLIRVVDNGCGIDGDQLGLAVNSHATSKIEDADDLFQIGTLGFRGEALASIAEVSDFRLSSRVSQAGEGAMLEVRGGHLGEISPCGCPVGTVVEVRNLFFNTPVRRKFLRTTQTELGHVSEAFTRIALAHPRIHFTLKHNDRSLFDLPTSDVWRSRIATFFGGEVAESLIWLESDDGPVKLSGYVANPSVSRGNNRMQYLFLNGRYIRDRALGHGLSEAYRGLLMTGRYPVVFLRMEIPPDDVDVNVHPTKLEVRFQDSGQIYSQLLGTLRNRFLTSDLTARVTSPVTSSDDLNDPAAAVDMAAANYRRDRIAPWAQPTPTVETMPSESRSSPHQGSFELQFNRQINTTDDGERFGFSSESISRSGHPHDAAATMPMACTPEGYPAVQVHNRYLITENEDGLVIIDQHALHERILYEELREKVLGNSLETQKLLVPETVPLTAAEYAAVMDSRDLLKQLGMEIEPFGGETVIVSTYPAMLANLSPDQVLRPLVEKLMSSQQSPDRRDVLDELLHMISCKAAIKAGDRLSREEISALIQRRQLVQDSHHCPHGRPTALVFTRDELDRRFGRT